MRSRVLLLYWNDLSFPDDISSAELLGSHTWKDRAMAAFGALQIALEIRRDCKMSFMRGEFTHYIGDRPLHGWLEDWLGKDRFRRLRASAVQPLALGELIGSGLEHELTCNGRCGDGITRAHLADTWTWSVGNTATISDGSSIPAEKISIDSDTIESVQVPNLAQQDHAEHWRDRLGVWGQTVSNNHVMAEVGKWRVIMYPLDHGYPHIHVEDRGDPGQQAKYRIDKFEPLTYLRPQGMDQAIEPWVEKYHDALMDSWNRCQRGMYPLTL
jgi:hypothetical protein